LLLCDSDLAIAIKMGRITKIIHMRLSNIVLGIEKELGPWCI
jgi:hypothetical protein